MFWKKFAIGMGLQSTKTAQQPALIVLVHYFKTLQGLVNWGGFLNDSLLVAGIVMFPSYSAISRTFTNDSIFRAQ